MNECDLGIDKCGYGSECVNSDGSFMCICRAGFTGDHGNCTGEGIMLKLVHVSVTVSVWDCTVD